MKKSNKSKKKFHIDTSKWTIKEGGKALLLLFIILALTGTYWPALFWAGTLLYLFGKWIRKEGAEKNAPK